jgi:hypothetical protein
MIAADINIKVKSDINVGKCVIAPQINDLLGIMPLNTQVKTQKKTKKSHFLSTLQYFNLKVVFNPVQYPYI